MPVVRYWTFYFNNNESLYIENKELKEKNNQENNDNIKHIVVKLNIENYIISSLKNNELLSQTKVATQPYLVKEKIPQIKWLLSNETKKIGNFICQKAQGDFRGRTYIVWFSKEIPIQLSPWKLFGLPGAILEFYDTTNQIYSIAINVELTSNININQIINKVKKKGKVIEIEKYVDLKNNESEEMLKFVMSKYGRDAKIKNIEPTKRQGFELFYEWEKK